MSDACVIATGAVSALGIGVDAYRVACDGEPALVAIARDSALESAKMNRPFAARAPADLGRPTTGDRATDLLICALEQTLSMLAIVRPSFRTDRIGVAIGTSSGGMLTAERFFAARAEGREGDARALAGGATYFAPLSRALDAAGLSASLTTQVLAACAASTIALGIGLRWLDRGACDLVLAGGYDGVSVFVAAGFEVLRATTASRPRPFRIGRDGMSLGEGAGIVALVREGDTRSARVLGRIAGFGASTDAVHITAPDRTGSGLARAANAALGDSGWTAERVGLVSAHATATPYNDAMESKALATVFASAPAPVVHPMKAQIGHTLGAAGILESLAAMDALDRGVAPAAAGDGPIDPGAPALLLERGERRAIDGALKLSAAFGGANAALVLTRMPSGRAPRAPRPVYLRASAHVESADLVALAEATGMPRDRLARLDTLCRLGVASVAALAASVGREALRGAGVVAGHAFGTIDTNELFDARRRARGATAVEPRLFPATSPNAIAGECAIIYGMTGPGCAVSAGLDGATEALRAAAGFVAMHDAERVVVVAADDGGPVAQALLQLAGAADRSITAGAVALLLDANGEGALREIPLDLPVDHARGPIGHLALMRWCVGALG